MYCIEREKYAWEMDDVLDTGMTINAKGQVYCILYILYTLSLLYAVHYILDTIRCMLYTILYMPYTVSCICILYTVSVHCILY
jgi:hypothetical protein